MRWLISIPLLLLTSGCADLGYYWHNASGHLGVMNDREDIATLIEDEQTDDQLRERLVLVQEIRQFSIDRLDLPDNGSYSSYVQLENPYVVQNIFAAPEFSTRLYQWCYPIVGCASYRGYFDETRLREYVETLEAEGLEVHVGRVPAYSTLGWFDDPVLSSFIDWPDYRLAGLIFHELTHQQLFIDGDTTFNESLASAVQQQGTRLWLAAQGQDAAIGNFERWLRYHAEVITLIVETRRGLDELYASDLNESAMRSAKALRFEDARQAHAVIAGRHGVTRGFTAWFAADLNNARIGSVAAYTSRVPAFVNMMETLDNDFARFYAYVETISELPRERRNQCLDAWEQENALDSATCQPQDG